MNKLSLGIIGLPNVGKSTLFGAVTKNEVNIANYPFCTIDPNIGVVSVPDERLEKLNEMSKSAKKIPAIVEFYDIAGLVRGANKGEGLGNKFLSHIRETNAVVEVLRCFESSEITHVENSIDPIRDMEIINAELSLKDLETVEKVMKTLEAEAKSGNKESAKDLEILKIAKEKILKGELLVDMKDEPIINKLQLLTSKPQIYLLNGKQEDVSEELIGKICYEVIKGLDQPCERCPIKTFLEKDVCQYRFEQCISSPIIEGIKYFDIIATPIENYDGQPASVEVLRDITESRTLREELKKHRDNLKELVEERTFQLQESEKWLSTTLKSIGDAVIATDTKGNISFLNPVAESLTGWKQEEAIEKPIE